MNKKPDLVLTSVRKRTRIVDLFCGAGGLSCGFDFSNNKMGYTTVLGLDIEPSAVALFNQNFRPTADDSKFDVGRTVDLNWFSHLAEIRLFFLSHISEVEHCSKTQTTLSQIGFFRFLAKLKSCDQHFGAMLEALASQALYKEAVAVVPKATSTLALVKTFFARFGLHTVQAPKISLKNQPWTFDYSVLLGSDSSKFEGIDARSELVDANIKLWTDRVEELRSASEKRDVGRIQITLRD